MCIVHEFGHSAVQWQKKTPPCTSQSFLSPIPTSSKTEVDTHLTPNLCKEAGRFVERQLFGFTIGLVCNKDPDHPKSKIWKNSLEVVGKKNTLLSISLRFTLLLFFL